MEAGASDVVKASLHAVSQALADYAVNFHKMADATLAGIALDEQELVPQIVAMQGRLATVQEALVRSFGVSSTANADMIDRGALIQEALAGVLLVVGTGLAAIIGRSIARPITGMTAVMARLAAGDRAVSIPARLRGDEIGDMARAVEVFKDNMITPSACGWSKRPSATAASNVPGHWRRSCRASRGK